ncbi:MAG: HD-GYP domain-containing protein [Bryobacteraceae bacterium]
MRAQAQEGQTKVRAGELAGAALGCLAERVQKALNCDHAKQVGQCVKVLARHFGLPEDEVDMLGAAALLHDLGKLGLPESILQKKGPLTADEWDIIRRHPAIGACLLAGGDSRLLALARQVALTHHEHWDGSGYPQQLRGNQIPLAGQLVMLADRYDALRSRRPYKPALDHETACRILLEGDERSRPEHFEPRVLAAFRELRESFRSIYDGMVAES